ncbi:GntR family transcriptional regulator [Nocardiopsis ansamitocini]|uniref:GntR family transcriptional regulator n=1 Tax=Nocardiopsis ansamitocini TaxID=1670832 RepID=A0A9W6UHV9_9ACTN|nr:GntR family transcriptional regulator [Nocardiopsis ansamitocini]GLU47044.1 GntR family transcriptional regulator [Nocardiopsis ansamitocini]
MAGQPRYLWLAEVLRRSILDGRLALGARVPSRAQLSRNFAVSEQVARNALRLLLTEGLLESRPGSGYYVREPQRAYRFPRTDRYAGHPVGPLVGDLPNTRSEGADRATQHRLGVRPGEPLYRTERVSRDEGVPVALHTSWEPVILTLNTSRAPGEAPAASVLDRLAAAGVFVDRVEEEVSVRALRGPEAEALDLPPGLPALLVQRTHFNGQRPVETSDLIASAENCRLIYRLSLNRPRTPGVGASGPTAR